MPEPTPEAGPAPETLAVLRSWADNGGPRATRARVVLLAEEGLRDADIARRLGVSRQTVGSWRHRWQSAGLPGLQERPRTGRPATVDEAEVITRALLAPGGSGASRAIARDLGLSHATVASIRRRWQLPPDEAPAPHVPTRPPLPGADIWVMGLYVDPLRAVLLTGTRPQAPRAAPAATVIGEDVLEGVDRALCTLRAATTTATTTASITATATTTASGTEPDDSLTLLAYLTDAAEHHPDIALHAVVLWEKGASPVVREPRTTGPPSPSTSCPPEPPGAASCAP